MIALRLAALAVGAALATVVVFTGPTDLVVCDSGHGLDDRYQRLSGGNHVDGASASYCEIPTGLTWFASAATLAAGLGVPFLLRRPNDGPRARPGE